MLAYETLSLLKTLEHYGVPVTGKHVACPFCNKEKKLSVTDYNYKCYSANCIAHQPGDALDFILLKEPRINSRTQAFSFYASVINQQNKLYSLDLAERVKVYRKAWNLMRAAAIERKDIILPYVQSRKWPVDFEYGFGIDLYEAGLLQRDLKSHGLLSSNNNQLLFNRLVFPIRHPVSGEIIHFQGRALDSSQEVRWLSTSDSKLGLGITKLFFNLNTYFTLPNLSDKVLFLTEGVGDCLTLLNIGLDAFACFGVEPNLKTFLRYIKPRALVVILDNDRFSEGTPLAGCYKSWEPFLKHLVGLSELVDYPIYCVSPPVLPGLKDVNDWALSTPSFDKDLLKKYCRENAKLYSDFMLDLWLDRPEKHLLIWRAASYHPNRFLPKLKTIVDPDSWPEYIISFLLMES